MLFLITILIIIDTVSKSQAKIYLIDRVDIIQNIFYLKLVKNPGIAFSINIPFLKIITILLIIGIIFYYYRFEKSKKDKYINLSFSFIIAGAIGNARERIFYSEVTDFIGINYFSIFNFADIFLTIGVFIYLGLNLLKKDKDGIK